MSVIVQRNLTLSWAYSELDQLAVAQKVDRVRRVPSGSVVLKRHFYGVARQGARLAANQKKLNMQACTFLLPSQERKLAQGNIAKLTG
jgi:hypothetical protein